MENPCYIASQDHSNQVTCCIRTIENLPEMISHNPKVLLHYRDLEGCTMDTEFMGEDKL